ncbi:MAG: SIS domain-containing protein [Labrys sp. (in: a-proteobacteria)]
MSDSPGHHDLPRTRTAMAAEIAQAPEAIARLLDREGAAIRTLGRRIAERSPPVIVTCARGSSDNAAAYAKYLFEILAGIPVASVGPSVASVYGARLRLDGGVVLSVSQSGKSPDIVALQKGARASGALAIAIVNEAQSPLAAEADAVVPIHAGPGRSVAATKTFLASAAALAALAAAVAGDQALERAVAGLPEIMAKALSLDWDAARDALASAPSAYLLGRGPAFPIAQEAALKLKETAVLHAEAYSSAEVMHGPLQLVGAGFPVIALRPADAAFASTGETLRRIAAAGGRVFAAEVGDAAPGRLPSMSTGHPFLDPLPMLASFYRLAEAVARDRGHDPDAPSQLKKVTETI